MPKGSQLTQLKAALNQAGINGSQSKGRKRKRVTVLSDKDKSKKAAKLEEIHKRLNPFDVKVTRLKHDVGGRRIKGAVGNPAQSKEAGIEQRKNSLLKEYEERHRAGGIIDRRFGENDPTMSLEERMLERFTRERKRAAKGAAFNLEDEDVLTHYGQSLSNLDDFDDTGLNLDEDEEEEDANGHITRDMVRKSHFGGFDDEEEEVGGLEEPARKKTKAEVMAEVMAKSKEHKLLRQMEREKEDGIRQKLDGEFDSLRELLYAPGPSSLRNAGTDPGIQDVPLSGIHDPVTQTPEDLLVRSSQDQDYDQQVRELAFDQRSKPKDRTKTEEELALEQKQALEKAESQRQRRMLGLEESGSEDEGGARRKRKRGGDDLEDDFDIGGEAWDSLGAGLAEQASSGEESVDEDEDSDDTDENKRYEYDENESDEHDERQELVPSPKRGEAKVQKMRSRGSKEELPFTFPCPQSHEEFLEILDGVEDEDVPIVVQRIRALHHTSLSPENKLKLQVLATVLIDHILHVTAGSTPPLALVSNLVPHVAALTKSFPSQTAEYFVQKLVLMQKNLKHGLSHGPLNVGSKTWPRLSELCFLRIIGALWPTSDLNHPVISPARVLMGSYLGLCRVRTIADLASGLFLCTLFLQYESLSKRFVPEAVTFVVNTVLHLAPHDYKILSTLPGSFPSPDFFSDLPSKLTLNMKSTHAADPRKADLLALLCIKVPDEQAKVDLLALAFDLLGRFADMYKSLEGFIELYEPILEILQNVSIQELVHGLQPRMTSLQDMLHRLLRFARQARQPLQLQAHKAIPIPTYIPKFDASASAYMRHKDPDHERNEATKLRRQYKQERKGAIRELRKDAKFLAGVAIQKQLDKDKAYNERMKRVFGSIEGERAEEKAMEREKRKEKRRAGRTK